MFPIQLRLRTAALVLARGVTAAAVVLGFFALSSCSENEVETPPSGHEFDDLVLARAGGKEIRVRDLHFKIKVQLPAMMEARGMIDVKQKDQVLQQMLDQYCWVDLAERKAYDEDPEFLGTLELSRLYILANHSAKREVYDRAEIAEDELRADYEANLDKYTTKPVAKGRIILLETEAEARRIRERLLGGADFETLARQYSIDEGTRPAGGDLGTVSGSAPVKGFANFRRVNDTILALEVGEISEPIQTPRGWAVFTAHERTDPYLRPFDEVKGAIHDHLYKKRANALFAATLDRAREEIGVEIDEENWVRYAASLCNDGELRNLARSEKDPEMRVLYYRYLTEDFPESDHAGMARFMVGFVLADELQRYDEARNAFQGFLDHHPNHELAESARWMIDNMEKGWESLPYTEQIKRRVREG